ncbi:MAG TPA: hypothetical protein VK421_07320 [Pyrinomonadaceae bacterium]|nr:hypothetical protein [Pyrinomonadaceae bacterium]
MKRRLHKGVLLLQAAVVLLVVVLATYVVARGQVAAASVKAEAGGAAAAPAFDQARFDRLRAEGFESLYSLDYETAQSRFKEMSQAFPDHPGGWQFQAAALWLKTLNQSRRLQSNLYNDDQFYEGEEDKADPKVVAEFKELTRSAKLLAEARLKKDKRDVEALYYLGATQGLKAAFAGAVERRFIGALQDGKDAVDLHNHAVKLDPNFHDARLSIGMYDYIVGGLPGPVKLLVNIFGRGGSKKRGLATLEQVVREGRWAQDDARVMLIPLYKRERRFEDAARAARELATKYPRNHLFKLEAADALVSQAAELRKTDPVAAQKIEAEAFAVFEALLKERGAPSRQHDQIHFQYADALFVAGQTEAAAKGFLAAATVANADAALATLARLRAAQSFDLAGKRADALAQYKAVLARPDVYKSHEAARRGLKEPFNRTLLKQRADAGAEETTETSKRGNEQ